MEWFAEFAQWSVDLVWDWPMALILTSCGLIFTLMTLGIQWKALTHGFQVIRGKYDNPDDHGNISHFQALCTALSATIGLGNISGVAVAVAAGGAGAVFWMWLVGFLGMATKFMTCSLATMYREQDSSGTYRGGPMYYIEIGLGKNWKPLAILFALLGTLASLGAGNMYQSNQVSTIFTDLITSVTTADFDKNIIHLSVGVVLFVLAIIVIVGGIKRIGAIASKVVPTMCVIYCIGALYVIVVNFGQVPELIGSIFQEAFSGTAAKGAFYGIIVMEAIKLGVKRACFSNEAGLGSAPIAHSTAKTNEPIREGVVAAVGPFIDTVVICTMTALVILITQSHMRDSIGTLSSEAPRIVTVTEGTGEVDYLEFVVQLNEGVELERGEELLVTLPVEERQRVLEETGEAAGTGIAEGKLQTKDGLRRVVRSKIPEDRSKWSSIVTFSEGAAPTWVGATDGSSTSRPVYLDIEGIQLTAYSFNQVIPGFGTWFLPIAAFFFAFSTIVSWGYYGETCVQYLFGDRSVLPFKFVYVSMILVGAYITNLKPVLNFSDAMLGLMLVPNLIGTFFLAPRVMRATQDYFRRLKAGEFEEDVRLAAEAKARKKAGE